MTAGGNGHGLSVTTKLFRILGSFTADRPRLRASDICRRSGLPFSTVHRLLAELVTHGALDHAPEGTYSVGVGMWALAGLNPQLTQLRQIARPRMHHLHATFHGDVHLDVPVGDEGLGLDELGTVHEDPDRRVGTRFPLHSTASGHVLLAYAGPEVREACLIESAAHPANAISSYGLRRILAEVRRSGVAVRESATRVSVAAPVFGPTGAIVAALEAFAPTAVDSLRLLAAVRSRSAEMTAALARPPLPLADVSGSARSNGHRPPAKLLSAEWIPPGQRQAP
jgi:DNA-binding IclR family transcriptional regulator